MNDNIETITFTVKYTVFTDWEVQVSVPAYELTQEQMQLLANEEIGYYDLPESLRDGCDLDSNLADTADMGRPIGHAQAIHDQSLANLEFYDITNVEFEDSDGKSVELEQEDTL
tara:strand:- start:152 stop:493 length:342 start_codon:yes stop_codon:yes gene_type:complete